MKFMPPKQTIEVVPNLAWIRKERAVISLYSLRQLIDTDSFGCDFAKAVEIVRHLDSNWEINHWCFDWTAERELTLWNGEELEDIFSVLTRELLDPLATVFGHSTATFIHGDADISDKYRDWMKKNKGRLYFNHVDHINRFYYHYNQHYPSARPTRLIKTAFTSFNRKHTEYRNQLFEFLKNNELLYSGYVNFAFKNFSTLVGELPEDYEENKWASESEIHGYYRASNFDIIIETASNGENQRFITEKTLRALALGQPFLVYNGVGTLKYLQGQGFETYKALWDESYDNIADPQKRFDAITAQIKLLADSRAIFDQKLVKEIGEHNQYRFQELAGLDHKERWLRNKI